MVTYGREVAQASRPTDLPTLVTKGCNVVQACIDQKAVMYLRHVGPTGLKVGL